MLRKYIIITFIIIGSINTLFSQSKADSLLMALDTLEGKAKVDVLHNLTRYYGRKKVYEALRYSNEALNLSRELNYNKGIQKSLYNLGVTYYISQDYKNAIINYRESLEYLNEEKDHKQVIFIYNNIGVIYYQMKDYEKALQYYNKVKDILSVHENLSQEVSLNTNFAIVFAEQEEFDSAKYYFDKLYQITSNSSFKNKRQILNAKLNISEFYIDIEDYKSASDMVCKAIKEIDTETEFEIKSGLYEALGSINRELGKFKESEDNLFLALEFAIELGTPRVIMNVREDLYKLYKNGVKINWL